jgi:hypothetical protein
MKDTRVLAAVEAQLGPEEKSPDVPTQNTSQPTVNKTAKILFETEQQGPGEHSVTLADLTKQDYKPSASQQPPKEAISIVSRTSEPESFIESQTKETTTTVTESDETPAVLVARRVEDLGDKNDGESRPARTSRA